MTTSNNTVFNFTYDTTSSKYGYLNSSGTFVPFEDSSDATASASTILSGYTAYVNGSKITGIASSGVNFEVVIIGWNFPSPSGSYLDCVRLVTYRSDNNSFYAQNSTHASVDIYNGSSNFSKVTSTQTSTATVTLSVSRNIKYIDFRHAVGTGNKSSTQYVSSTNILSASAQSTIVLDLGGFSSNNVDFGHTILSWPV